MTARKNAERELARREIHRRKSSGLWGFKLRDLAEPALVMGSSMIAEPISGLAGITALPFGAGVAAGVVEGVQDALTFEPRLQKTKDDLAALSHAVEPIGDAIQKLSTVPGDAVFEATGSPFLATMAHSAIPAAAELLGLKGASKLGGAKFEVGDIGGQGSKIGGKQRGVVANIKRSEIETTLPKGKEGAERFKKIKAFDPGAKTSKGKDGNVVVTHENVKKTRREGFKHLGPDAIVERYQDLDSGGYMDILQTPGKERDATVLGLFVPENERGKGAAKRLLSRVMSENPSMSGQVSSKAAATNAFASGRRPSGNPEATLEDVFKIIDDRSSVNMITRD